MIGINKKRSRKAGFIIIIFIIVILFDFFIYALDKAITPAAIAVADSEMRAKALQTVNSIIFDEFSKQSGYDEIINVEKDKEGNITLMKANTIKLNKTACDIAVKSQDELKRLGTIGIKIPMGYIFKNNIIAYLGPNITVKMEPIGSIETRYLSQFESAGINQTRHKIFIEFKTQIRVILPFDNNEVEIKNEMPIAETIIVGKVPDTTLNFDLEDAGFHLDNNKQGTSK